MDLLIYTKEHHQFRNRLQNFIKNEILPYEKSWESEHIVPKDAWKKMGQMGFLCPCVPEAYGGMGGDFLYSVIVSQELSKIGHVGLAAPVHSDVTVPYIVSYGSEELRKKYLPGCVSGDIISAIAMTEPSAGSDLTSMETSAIEDGDEVIISGSKTFISNGINCDIAIVAARHPEVDNPHQGISLYIIESGTPGFQKGKKLNKMGLNSQDTAELFFNDCRIPKTNLLGTKTMGFIMLMEKLQQERLVVSMGAVYSAERCVNQFIKFCKEYKGKDGKPLSVSQDIQFALVEMATDVKIGRTFMETLIMDHMQGSDIKIDTSMAKFWTTDLHNRVINRGLDITGEYGILEKNEFAKGFRDARISTIFAGTNEIMKLVISRLMQI